MMPVTAILRHELRTLLRGWLVKLWLVAALFGSLVAATGEPQLPVATRIAMIMAPFLVFPWFLFVMVLGLTPVTGARSDSLADGILSRPIARYQFLLGSWGARVVLVLGVFLVATVPFVLWVSLAARPPGASDMTSAVTLYGTLASVGVVALVLTFQVSLAFLFGTLLRNPLWTIVVLLFFWYLVMNMVLHQFRLEEFSPLSLNQAIPTLAQQPPPWAGEDAQDAKDAEAISKTLDAVVNWSFFTPAPQKPARSGEADFYLSEEYEDFSLAWVLFTYGLLTAGSIGLAILCFGMRDL